MITAFCRQVFHQGHLARLGFLAAYPISSVILGEVNLTVRAWVFLGFGPKK